MRIDRARRTFAVAVLTLLAAGCGGGSADLSRIARAEVEDYLTSSSPTGSVSVQACFWLDPGPSGPTAFGVYSCRVRSDQVIELDRGRVVSGIHLYCFDVPRANHQGAFDRMPSFLGPDNRPVAADSAFASECLDRPTGV